MSFIQPFFRTFDKPQLVLARGFVIPGSGMKFQPTMQLVAPLVALGHGQLLLSPAAEGSRIESDHFDDLPAAFRTGRPQYSFGSIDGGDLTSSSSNSLSPSFPRASW